MNDNKDNSFMVITIALIVLLFIIITPFIGCDVTYSEGFRDGIVQKFSKKGVFFKSWEGTLIRDGMVQNNDSNFLFSVGDNDVARQIQELKPNTVVRLHYTQVWKNCSAYHETSYRITKIEIVK